MSALRRLPVVATLLIALVAGVLAPGAAGQSRPGGVAGTGEPAPGEVRTAAEAAAAADEAQIGLDEALAGLAGAEAEVAAAAAEQAAADAELAASDEAVADATESLEDARSQISGWAVAAYVAGGRVPDDVSADVLLTGSSDIDPQRHRRIALDVGEELLSQRARAEGALAEAVASRETAGARVEAAGGRVLAAAMSLDEATATRDERAAEVERLRGEVVRLAEAEAREAERRALEAFLRATTPHPEPIPTVTLDMVVPAEVVAEVSHIPPRSLDAYWRAAMSVQAIAPGCQIDWALLAAVGHVESGHGTTRGAYPRPDGGVSPGIVGIELPFGDSDGGRWDGDPVADRAMGPMQFIPTTWAGYASDGNGDGITDPHNIYDETLAAAWYLCRNGHGLHDEAGVRNGLHAYNRSWAYVARVYALAEEHRRMLDD